MSFLDKCTVKLFRYDPSVDDTPYYEVYQVPAAKKMRVIDALNYIYEELNSCFAYRWYCGVKRCGECSFSVNGKSVISCWEPAVADMKCEPLTNFPIIRDLVVDPSHYEQVILSVDPFVKRRKFPAFPEMIPHSEMEPADRLSSCIECNVCTAEVPVKGLTQRGIDWSNYSGPAALVKFARFLLDPRDETERRSIAEQIGLENFPLFENLKDVCPQGIDILGDALAPSRRKLFDQDDVRLTDARSQRVFVKARDWSAFVRLTKEQCRRLIDEGRLEALTASGLDEAYSLCDDAGRL